MSNVTGGLVSAEEMCSPEYWVRHVRETVRFFDGVRCLQDRGVRRFLELGPDGVLSAMSQESWADGGSGGGGGSGSVGDGDRGTVPAVDEQGEDLVAASVLRGARPEVRALMDALAEVWVSGVHVDWELMFAGSGARRVGLPSYAFQREHFWLEGGTAGVGDLVLAGQGSAGHPLLGAIVGLAGGEGWLFTGRLSLDTHSWLVDHAVLGTALLPGTAFPRACTVCR